MPLPPAVTDHDKTEKHGNSTVINALTPEALCFISVAAVAIIAVTIDTWLLKNLMLIASVVLFWTLYFSSRRAQPFPALTTLTTVLLLLVLLPVQLQWWQVVVFCSFGVVLGEQVFGGYRYALVHPVIAALALYHYSYTQIPQSPVSSLESSWLLILALLLIITRAIDWRAPLAAAVVFSGLLLVSGLDIRTVQPDTAVVVCIFFTVFAVDFMPPQYAARYLYGGLLGLLLLLLDPALQSLAKTVSACLLLSLTAPLINHVAMRLNKPDVVVS